MWALLILTGVGFYPSRGQQETLGPGARKPEFKSWSLPPVCDHLTADKSAERPNLTFLSEPGKIATPPLLRNLLRFKGTEACEADSKITTSAASQHLF